MSCTQSETAQNQLTTTSVVTLAASGLEQMLDPEHKLFCFTLRQGASGLVREGISHRYTMMTLLGLDRFEKAGQTSPVPISPILDRLIADTGWIDCVGDLGLLLWTCAILAPERLAAVADKTRVRDALARYQDAREGRTMELAWFLTGLCYSAATELPGLSDLREEANKTFRSLAANQGCQGIFRHLGHRKSMAAILRGRIGSFADQVYPIYALAKFSALTGSREALERASACAESICQRQGPSGEWWWHYDAGTGRVVETYPAYSVHQDGMAPMALFALADVSGRDFTVPIQRGLAWIQGNNELGRGLVDPSRKLIWRNLQLSAQEQFIRRLFPSRQIGVTPARKLEVNRECRPYELGWALYALAGREHLCACARSG